MAVSVDSVDDSVTNLWPGDGDDVRAGLRFRFEPVVDGAKVRRAEVIEFVERFSAWRVIYYSGALASGCAHNVKYFATEARAANYYYGLNALDVDQRSPCSRLMGSYLGGFLRGLVAARL